ncbi:MAG: glycoside hydrolase family 127 protein [Bacteroidaceae bacterium]|nr:glycoside hydrolase family 127 protein [Bacteroidaceae bacterium]MBQ9170616.1 glycoside hydrolase family 127 protein [Bacteroidaceae bacterium]MBQ9293295.1 glycoside hydrolase family 127 protein [Bacteroidaceae bacterium]
MKRTLLVPVLLLLSLTGRSAEFAFREGLIADITPKGWLLEFLQRQKTGLTGHPDALSYPYNTCLWAGEIPRNGNYGEDWWRYEQTAYYTDGLLRLGYLLDDEELIAKGEQGIRYTLNHQQTNGRIGSSVISSLWPQAVFWRTMKAYADAHGTPSSLKAALRRNYNSMTQSDLATGRRHILNLEGLLWLYGETNAKALLTKAENAYKTGGFEFDASEAGSPELTHLHGVTYCEMLKVPLLLYAYTGDEEYLRIAMNAERKLERDHLLPDGVPSSSEYTVGHDIDIAHETCDITDYTWSLGYFLTVTGQAEWADRIERAIFNAAPGAVTKNFDAVQYFSSVNQVICTGNSDNNAFKRGLTWMAYRPTHETECCAGNMHRMMPNFASRLWMRGKDDAIVAAMYAPSEIDFKVGEAECHIAEETYYPFSGDITFRFALSGQTRFPFTFRIPGWCEQYEVKINGQPMEKKDGRSGSFLTLERDWSDGDVVSLSLTMTPKVVEAAGGQGKYVECGPLLMAYPVPANVTEDTKVYSNMNGKTPGDGFKCWSMTPSGPWNYAMNTDAETLTLKVDEEKLASAYPFDLEGTPLSVELPVRPITWTLEQNRYNPVQPASESVVTSGAEQTVSLVPYGATTLRLTVFPDALRQEHKTLTDSLLVNPDFELVSATQVNHSGTEKKTYRPYGWSVRGTLSGNSYGINHDAYNHHGENVCWYRTLPFPTDFQLYQTVPASKLKPGTYRVRCLLWCQKGQLGTCGLFANNNVQYYGKQSDYGENLPKDVTATFAGHTGFSSGTFIMEEMEVTVSIGEGESLTLGICTSPMKSDGTEASSSDPTGWFKVDHFRIERITDDETSIRTIDNRHALDRQNGQTTDNKFYNLLGQQTSDIPNGLYIRNGKIILNP